MGCALTSAKNNLESLWSVYSQLSNKLLTIAALKKFTGYALTSAKNNLESLRSVYSQLSNKLLTINILKCHRVGQSYRRYDN
jgi:hypothetical protein